MTWGTTFWRTFRATLLANPQWTLAVVTDVLTHDPTGCEVRLSSGHTVSLRRPSSAGQQLFRSRKDAPDAAALEVAAMVWARINELVALEQEPTT